MKVTPFELPGLFLIEPKVIGDHRGFFLESYRKDTLAAAGIPCEFVQDNHSQSTRGTIRGLHFQTSPGQDKLVRCTAGAIWDVALDIRPNSPTFGRWTAVELTAENKRMFFVPIGFAHGFAVTSPVAEVQYRCSNYYDPVTEAGVQFDDPDLGIPWPIPPAERVLSKRDQTNPAWREFCARLGKTV